MIYEEEITENKPGSTTDLTFKNVIKIIVFKPTTEIDILLNQVKYKYAYLFPALYAIIVGISKSVNNSGSTDISHLIPDSIFSIAQMLLFSYLFCFIYAWIVKFISNLLQGSADISMIFGLISYSLVPLIIGAILYLLFKIIIYSTDALYHLYISTYTLFYYGQLIFVAWSLFILMIGNAFINNFSMIRSFISSISLAILVILLTIFRC